MVLTPNKATMQTTLNLRKILAAMVVLMPLLLPGQALQWSYNYGGSNTDFLSRIITSKEGGFMAAGHSISSDHDLPVNSGMFDAWIIKSDDNGHKDFVTVMGGSENEFVADLLQREDSLYLVLINSTSADGDFPANAGSTDIWLKGMNISGTFSAGLRFGGSGNDEATRIVRTLNGGYLIVGKTNSADGTFSGTLGGDDAFCIRLDPQFQVVWARKYGTKDHDGFVDALALPDGSLLFYGSKFIGLANTGWLLKTNPQGDVIDEADIEKFTGFYPVCMQHHDGKFYLAANTDNMIDRVTDQHIMVYVYDENLDYAFMMESGGGAIGTDAIVDMKHYDDDHLLCLVASGTNSGLFTGSHGGYDLFTLLISDDLLNFYSRPFGGSANEGWALKAAGMCLDGTMAVVAGNSYSSDGDLPSHYGMGDGWIFKADPLYSLGLPGEGVAAVAGIQVSPNPAEDEILVSGIPDEAAFITITDLTGRQVFRTGVDRPSVNIPLSGLPSGMYLVRAATKGRVLPPVKFVRR
ncbi:hypothetical protein SDC9_26503 [bioreactor metagenome]|uniref:Secretion system C-terminal sorting domain-containing protein n=2 Tax=root TaxID=1 RepID=A0A644UPB4_9ZZZZ